MKNTNAPTDTCLLLPVALPALKQLMIIDACNSGKKSDMPALVKAIIKQVDEILKKIP